MKSIFRITVIVLLIALLAAVLFRKKQNILIESKSNKLELKEIPVEVTTLIKSSPQLKIKSTGIVESLEEIIVVSTVQGPVRSVEVFIGESVKQGDVIAVADDFYATKEYSIASDSYRQLQKEFVRSEELSKEAAVTGQQLEQLKIQLEGANIKQQTLQRRLEDTRIKAPVNGTINHVFVKKGSVLGNGSPVCEIVNPAGLKVTAHIPANNIELLDKNMPVQLSDNSDMLNSFTGTISGIGVKPDRTGLYPLSIQLPSNTTGIKPGMLLNAEIEISSPTRALLIPRNTIKSFDDKRGVFILEKNRAKFCIITTGKKYSEQIEVISGIEEGSMLITNGHQFLEDGDAVKVVKP